MNPEMPYAIAGAVAFVGGWKKAGGWPKNAIPGIAAVLALIMIASLTSGTKAAPLMRSFGWLLVFAAVSATVLEFSKKR